MIVNFVCVCGVSLRWSKHRRRYEPVAGSVAQRAGHVPVAVVDGVRRAAPAGAVCMAVPADELAEKRARRKAVAS